MARFTLSINDEFLDEFEGKKLDPIVSECGIKILLTNNQGETRNVAEFSSNYPWMILREFDENDEDVQEETTQ